MKTPNAWTYERWPSWFKKKYGEEQFDFLTESLFDQCQTLEAVGQHFGVSHERVRQWRNIIRKWKPELVSQGTQRKYCNILARPNLWMEAEKKFILSPAVAYCKKRAEEEGLKVELKRREKYSYLFNKSALVIEGKLCRISFNRIIWHTSECSQRLYFHCQNSRRKCDYKIICCLYNSIWTNFIFPREVLRTRRMIYIPVDLDRPSRAGPKPAIDWKLYREAWDLLRAKDFS